MKTKLEDFFGDTNPVLNDTDLHNALYSVDEADMWPDYVDSVSKEQAILCWRIIEKLTKEQFPDELNP